MKIDKEKVVDYVKTYATLAKDRVVATWESGIKGKMACVAASVIILWGVKSCLIGDDVDSGGVLGSEYRFSEEDFRTEANTEKMFYVIDGDDDGLKEVVPNLKRIPSILTETSPITAGFRPQNDVNVGKVFFTDPNDYIRNGMSTVTHVDDGWIVVRADGRSVDGEYDGFIYTHDTYIEGQKLKAGYYVLIGTQKVPLVNGSSKTMFAFVCIDEVSNRLALEAKSYNEKARRAAEKENMRRGKERENHKAELNRRQFHIELAKVFSGFSLGDMKTQFHFPKDVAGATNDIEHVNPNILYYDSRYNMRKYAVCDFLKSIKECDWGWVTNYLWFNYDPGCDTPSDGAKKVLREVRSIAREFRMSQNHSVDANKLQRYEFCIADRCRRNLKIYRAFGENKTTLLPIGAEVYCIRKVDEKHFGKFIYGGDVEGFVAAWKEREVYNEILDKFNPVFHREIARMFAEYVTTHFHSPQNADGNDINVKDILLVFKNASYVSGCAMHVAHTVSDPVWDRILEYLNIQISADTNPNECAREAFARILANGKVLFQMTKAQMESVDFKFEFFRVGLGKVEFVREDSYNYGDGYLTDYAFRVQEGRELSADLFCVRKEDTMLFKNIRDVKTFEEKWKEKYGNVVTQVGIHEE